MSLREIDELTYGKLGYNIIEKEIEFIEGLSGLDISKTKHKELSRQFHEGYVKQLKNWDIKQIERQSKCLNTILLPIIKDMIEATNQEIESRKKNRS